MEVTMKRFIGIMAAVALVLALASPVLAASLGVSPSHTELEVPGNGSATANFKVHYFSGDLKVSLVDIPLRVEPQTIHVDASSEPADIQVTIYGDESLGSQVYNGYIMFLGITGQTVAVGIKTKATVNHIVAGQPLPQQAPQEEAPIEETPPEQAPSSPPATQGETGELPLTTVIIIAAALVFVGLLVLSMVLIVRRR